MRKEMISDFFRREPTLPEAAVALIEKRVRSSLGIEQETEEAEALCRQIGSTLVQACSILRIPTPEVAREEGFAYDRRKRRINYFALASTNGDYPIIYYSKRYVEALLVPIHEQHDVETITL